VAPSTIKQDLVARVLGGEEEEANSLLILKMALEPGCRAQAKHLFVQTLHTKVPFPLWVFIFVFVFVSFSFSIYVQNSVAK